MRIVRVRFLPAAMVWPVCVLAQSDRFPHMDDDHMDGYWHMMDFWGAGVVMWLLLLGLVVVLIYILVRAARASDSRRTANETPADILKKRYARGEITKEQFEEMKKDV